MCGLARAWAGPGRTACLRGLLPGLGCRAARLGDSCTAECDSRKEMRAQTQGRDFYLEEEEGGVRGSHMG